MLHTFTLAVSKEWAPRWQSCRCPCSSIHPELRGLSPWKLQGRISSHNAHSAANNVPAYIYAYIHYIWFVRGNVRLLTIRYSPTFTSGKHDGYTQYYFDQLMSHTDLKPQICEQIKDLLGHQNSKQQCW